MIKYLKQFLINGKSRWALGVATTLSIVFTATFAFSSVFPLTLAKEALDANGNPITGTVNVGDTINYVLSYDLLYGPTPASNVTIDDTLSANQTFVDGSIVAPPGWTWTTPPYGTGNHTQYSHPGFGAENSFTMDVSLSGAGAAVGGGDGTYPIPVGTNAYGIYHHNSQPLIVCWDLATLAQCNGYPKVASSVNLDTPTAVGHAIVGTTIYYPVFRRNSNPSTIDYGIGCWDTASNTECTFASLASFSGGTQTTLYNPSGTGSPQQGYTIEDEMAGVAQDPSNPNRLFMLVGDYGAGTGQVFCRDMSGGAPGVPCTGWNPPTLAIANNFYWDIRAEPGPSPTRLFVQHGDAATCLDLNTGAVCNGWPLAGVDISGWVDTTAWTGFHYIFSFVPDLSDVTQLVCIHGATMECLDVADGSFLYGFTKSDAQNSGGAIAFPNGVALRTLRIPDPNAVRIIYAPGYPGGETPCLDWTSFLNDPANYTNGQGNNAPDYCAVADWSPYWGGLGKPAYQDYGYAIDPSNPDNCILGLGHAGVLWRFAFDGTETSCGGSEITETFELTDFFCSALPTAATWDDIIIHNRPTELTGGTIVLKDINGNVVSTIAVTASDTYPINISALGDNSTLTAVFSPTYAGDPGAPYQLEITFSADKAPQICYQAVVGVCGVVSNEAILQAEVTAGGSTQTVTSTVDLGEAVGPDCPGANCLDIEHSLILGEDGHGILTLHSSGPFGFGAGTLSLNTMDPSVSVWPQYQAVPSGSSETTWQLFGLVPGQTVTFQADAVQPGGGSQDGIDLCCSSTIEVQVPIEEEPVEIDLALSKEGYITGLTEEGPVPGTTPGYEFALTVTHNAGAIGSPQGIQVVDVVPAGLSFVSASGSGWDCVSGNQFPLSAGEILRCVFTDATLFAPGDELPPIIVNALALGTGEGEYSFQNCATLRFSATSTFVDVDSENDSACFEGHFAETESRQCDPETATLEGGECVCRHPSMRRLNETRCGCPSGTEWQGSRGCVTPRPQVPVCDRETTYLNGNACVCLYEDMERTSRTQCGCDNGEDLVPGVGCVRRPPVCEPPFVRDVENIACGCPEGYSPHGATACVRDRDDDLDLPPFLCGPLEELNPARTRCRCLADTSRRFGLCVPREPGQPLVCEEPFVPNESGRRCRCPEGTARHGTDGCIGDEEEEEEGRFRFNIGVGIGVGGGDRDNERPRQERPDRPDYD